MLEESMISVESVDRSGPGKTAVSAVFNCDGITVKFIRTDNGPKEVSRYKEGAYRISDQWISKSRYAEIVRAARAILA
jgi:hypothetical protein